MSQAGKEPIKVQQSRDNDANYAMVALFSVSAVLCVWALFSVFDSPTTTSSGKTEIASV